MAVEVTEMYSALRLESATPCCLTDCQLIKHLPRNDNPTRALAHVNVAGVVAVTITDEVRRAETP